MADEVPDTRKSLAGGLLALGPPAASGVAALLVGTAALGETARLLSLPLLTAVCVAPLLLVRGGPVETTQPLATQPPMTRGDLAIAWTARLLVQVAGNVLAAYLLYYFESIVPIGESDLLPARVAHLLLVASLLPLPIALGAGRLSDRIGRRKPILFVAATVAALGLGAMAIARSWPLGAIGFSLYMVGSAVFLALHAAFTMQLLPDPRHRGRDLGLLNLTNTLPALIGPLLAWSLATPRNFAPVMIVLAAVTFGGGATLLAVRGRR